MDWMGGGMIWFGLVMMVFGLLVFLGIILVAVWAIPRLPRSDRRQASNASSSPDDPLTILQRRYAKGEITRDEYERIRSDLKG